MSFGKRRPQAASEPRRTVPSRNAESPAAVVSAEKSPEQRYFALRDCFLQIFATASMIADAARSHETIPIERVGVEIRADAAPLDITALGDHFSYVEHGQSFHPVFGYVAPTPPFRVDESAQLHLHQLVQRIMELNVFCQRADRDGAMRVALQSPRLPALVDRVLAGSAFVAGYFEGLSVTQPILTSGGLKAAAAIDFPRLAEIGERRRAMTRDRMLVPEAFDTHVPVRKWPFAAFETATRPHAGQRHLNGIYFPKGLTPQTAPLSAIRTASTALAG